MRLHDTGERHAWAEGVDLGVRDWPEGNLGLCQAALKGGYLRHWQWGERAGSAGCGERVNYCKNREGSGRWVGGRMGWVGIL